MDPLGKRIKDKRKVERLSAEDLAIKLGTKKENIYKWEEGATPSNPEIFNRLMQWLDGKEQNTNISEDPYKEKYIKSLEREVHYLEKTIQASLIGLSDNIIVNRATIRAGIQYQTMKDSKGDEKKREVLEAQINKLIALQLTGGRVTHNGNDGHK
jgi:transcriptional regulator with XRE-family HTH domain